MTTARDATRRAIKANAPAWPLDRACSLPPAAGMDGEQVGGGRVLLTYEEAVDALLVAGWRPPADDAAVERAALAAAADDLEEAAVLLADWAGYAPEWARSRHNFDADLATVNAAAAKARAALAAAEEGEA